MRRRRDNRLRAVDGVLLLNKPAGLTSNQVLQRVKRMLRARKGGHAGSLDPAATGMLPLCFGEATKACAYLLDADKTYRVTALLGIATDTGDADGRETARAAVPQASASDWTALLQQFVGESLQVPPMYSALKKDGKRLYEYARRGQTVQRAARPISIASIDLLEAASERLVFRVTCSKGTYVRALVEDIAKAAGTVAHTAHLHRECVAGFDSTAMIDLAAVDELAAAGELERRLIRVDETLSHLAEVTLTRDAAERFGHGQAVRVAHDAEQGPVRVYGPERGFIGIGRWEADGSLAPQRIFRAADRDDAVSGKNPVDY